MPRIDIIWKTGADYAALGLILLLNFFRDLGRLGSYQICLLPDTELGSVLAHLQLGIREGFFAFSFLSVVEYRCSI